MDKVGFLRVDWLLKNSPLDFDSRHPIILPRSHPVTVAIIVGFHKQYHKRDLALFQISFDPNIGRLGGGKRCTNVSGPILGY